MDSSKDTQKANENWKIKFQENRMNFESIKKTSVLTKSWRDYYDLIMKKLRECWVYTRAGAMPFVFSIKQWTIKDKDQNKMIVTQNGGYFYDEEIHYIEAPLEEKDYEKRKLTSETAL